LAKNKKTEEEPQPAAKKKPEGETVMEFISSMASVLVTGIFIVTFLFQAFEIPSTSMLNTLLVGDHLWVDRTSFAPKTNWIGPLLPYRDVKDGDIVVFLSPIEPDLHVVKRIIGVPGDRIHLDHGVVYRNGQRLNEPNVIRTGFMAAYNPYRDDFPSVSPDYSGTTVSPEWSLTLPSHIQNGELVVPPDSYFAMGDNRDASYDSRYWGFIPKQNLIGRPMFIYWSFVTGEDQYKKSSMNERVGWIFHVIIHFFSDTRWNRTLRFVR
jgi:signal peptidase I